MHKLHKLSLRLLSYKQSMQYQIFRAASTSASGRCGSLASCCSQAHLLVELEERTRGDRLSRLGARAAGWRLLRRLCLFCCEELSLAWHDHGNMDRAACHASPSDSCPLGHAANPFAADRDDLSVDALAPPFQTWHIAVVALHDQWWPTTSVIRFCSRRFTFFNDFIFYTNNLEGRRPGSGKVREIPNRDDQTTLFESQK